MEPQIDPRRWETFDLIKAITSEDKGENTLAYQYVLEKNLCLNTLPKSPLAAALAAGHSVSSLFLIACGAIPTVQEWESCPDELLRDKIELIARQLVRNDEFWVPETLASKEYKKNPKASVQVLIRSCHMAALAIDKPSVRNTHFPGKYAIEKWRAAAGPATFELRPLQMSLPTSKRSLIDDVCDRGDEDAIMRVLQASGGAVERNSLGGWSLEEEALQKGWEKVARHVNSLFIDHGRQDVKSIGVLLASNAIDDSNPHQYCDVQLKFEHSQHVMLWAHYAIIAVRCPKLAEEINKTRRTFITSPLPTMQSITDAINTNTKLNFFKPEITVITLKERFSVMKALLEFLYLDFVTASTWRILESDDSLRELTGAAVFYQLPALAQACNRKIKKEPYPWFFKTHEYREKALLQAAQLGQATAPSRRAPVRFPTLAEQLLELITPKEGPSEATVQRLIEAGADLVIVADGVFMLTFDWIVCLRNAYFKNIRSAGMRETNEGIIRMSDSSYEATWAVVQYLLTDCLSMQLEASAALEGLQLVHYFDVPRLAPLLERQVVETAAIDDDIVLQLAQYASDLSSDRLFERCVNYFAENPQSLTLLATNKPEEFWNSISQSNLDTIVARLGESGKITARNLKMLRSNWESSKTT